MQQLLSSWLLEQPLFLSGQLRLILVGGETISPELLRLWQQLSPPNTQLFNVYGPTEATITATYFDLTSYQVEKSVANIPIGQPLPGRELYILDQAEQLVPFGVVGELHLGGAGLARGYLNRPELTAEKFIPPPPSLRVGGHTPSISSRGMLEGGGRLYKTGDLARWLPNGTLEFLGRVDNQIKLRGFRIELGEIEAVLSGHAEVRQAAVVLYEKEAHKQLVAYVVASGKSASLQGASLQVASLQVAGGEMIEEGMLVAIWRTFLRDKLPDYMVPAAFVLLEQFPLTPNGKVDRNALPEPDSSALVMSGEFTPPRNFSEEILANIWGQLLHLERVSVYDNFFNLGGDSIISLQMISLARQQGIHISPQHIFQHQSIAELGIIVEHQPDLLSANGPSANWTPNTEISVLGEVPLTPIQHEWAALKLPNPNIYNQTVFIEIDRATDMAQLSQSIRFLLRYHDALRLRYQPSVSGWRQEYTLPTDEVFIEEIEMSGLSEEAYQQKVAEASQLIEQTLNLESGPVMGLALFRRVDGPSHLLWMAHHLVVDWVSWRILLGDLERVYQQLQHQQPIQLPPPTSSLQQWATWLQERGPQVVAHEVDYWVSRLQGGQTLPLDYPQGEATWASMQAVVAELSPAETQALLQQTPAAYDTQINDLLLTALLLTLSKWTQYPYLLLELESHGREPLLNEVDSAPIDLSRTVGWFTSTFPVRLEYQESTLEDLIVSVKEQLQQIPNRGLGYGILRYLQSEPTLDQYPRPQIMFNYLGQFEQPTSKQPNTLLCGTGMSMMDDMDNMGDIKASEFIKQNGSTKLWSVFDLELMVLEGQFKLIWLYSANLHQSSTIEQLTQQFMTNLRDLIKHCQQQVLIVDS